MGWNELAAKWSAPQSFKAATLGYISNMSTLVKFGRNNAVDAVAAQEDIWAGSGLYTGFPNIAIAAAETVTVVSSSANDAAAGTGMRTVRLEGLGSDGKFLGENVTMNGLTPVTSVGQFYRLNRAYGLTGGSGMTNAGTVTIKHSVTTANVFSVILPGEGQSHNACYTVPIDKIGLLTRATLGISNNASTAQEATACLAVRAYQTSFWRLVNDNIVSTASPLDLRSDMGALMPPLTDMSIRIISATANNLVATSTFELLLVQQ